MRRLFTLSLLLGLAPLGGCEITPDPCAGYRLACLAVTVESGPPELYQLQVVVEGYSSTTPLTPRRSGQAPLPYPLRFAVQFTQEFDGFHRGKVILDVVGLGSANQVLAQARQEVAVSGIEKRPVALRLGSPLDLRGPEDLRPGPDLSPPPDLQQSDLADGGAGD